MTAELQYTHTLSTPRRPSLDDLGGAAYEQDAGNPPPDNWPNAPAMNQSAMSLAGLNRVCPLAVLHVTFAAGAPVLSTVRGMRAELAPQNFTVTDNGAGDTTIAWPATLLPGLTFPPQVSLAEDVEVDRVRAYAVAGGVRVKTKLAAVGTDAGFLLVLI